MFKLLKTMLCVGGVGGFACLWFVEGVRKSKKKKEEKGLDKFYL